MKKSSYKQLRILYVIFCCVACKNLEKKEQEGVLIPNWTSTQDYYLESITNSIAYLDSLAAVSVDAPEAKYYFKHAREAFKKAEPYASYLNPEVGHRANGPALPILTDDSQRVLNPIGLQKLEESIYEGEINPIAFKAELERTQGLLRVLQKSIIKHTPDAQRYFIATHQQLLRIISLGISGFDTPVSQIGLQETQISLQSLWDTYHTSIRAIIKDKDEPLDTAFKNQIGAAIEFIAQNENFITFDRYTFIRDYMNPLTRKWVQIRKTSELWDGVNNKPFNFDAPTFFEDNSFNVNYFTPVSNRNPSQKQIQLGEKLFFDPNLSKSGKMACATCHIPDKAYADGLVVNFNNQGSTLKRNTPTLINSVYQKGFFWDGRSSHLMDQISGVFTNEEEFDSAIHEFSDALQTDSTYIKLFNEAFSNKNWKNTEVIKALASYIGTLNTFNSKFDRNIRGEEDTFTSEEKLGFNLFMGKALCATCHFMPLTNGTVPPFFTDTEKEVIGVPETQANLKLDDDLGFYWRFEQAIQKGMFKTPTVRNVAVTAPYMHNGVYDNLEQVVDFYNKGGGAGLGFELPHQTLPFDNLDLSEKEQTALVLFMKTLTDKQVDVSVEY